MDPVVWQGRQFRWEVPLAVRAGLGILDLSPANATTVEAADVDRAEQAEPRRATSSGVARAAPTRPNAPAGSGAQTSAPGQARPPAGFKDAGTGTLISVLIAGGGHLYAGESGKGVTLLLGYVVGSGVALAGASSACGYYSCEDHSSQIAVGLSIAVASWIYGIADSGGAARRANARNGFAAGQLPLVTPVVSGGPGGGAQVGVRIALRH
ncbi:MAG: hypothetical protein WKG32_13040 [Gemmatimonadaceae bacterium]